MRVMLSDEEVRVLGALVEKSVTTPEHYPLSLNAVGMACNQKSSRDPVVAYDETTVARALEGLKEQHLLWVVSEVGARVTKYKHRFAEAFDLSEPEVALLCLLLLRGPQTPGELRSRSERLYPFATVEEIERLLEGLYALEEGPLAVNLPRQPGRKEHRWAHTFQGIPEAAPIDGSLAEARVDRAVQAVRDDRARLLALEAEVASLKEELASLHAAFEAFRKEFQ